MKTLLFVLGLVAGLAAPVMAHEVGAPHTHPSLLEVVAAGAVILAIVILPARLFRGQSK